MAEAAGWREQVESLQAEVLRLQKKLGELHGGDYNTLRRAYTSLCQHVAALEEEARGMVAEMQAFETQFVPPELVAQELGVAAAVAFGVLLLRTTVRALPLKSSGPVIIKGMWLLGGAYVLARLTGGTLAHMVTMFGRNASRKRRLQKQLEAVEERIQIMVALRQWAEKQAGPAVPAELEAGPRRPSPAAEAGPREGGLDAGVVPPPRRVSPATSSGSSVEVIEMPQAEELEAAEAQGASAAQAAATGQRQGVGAGGSGGAGAGQGGRAGGEQQGRGGGGRDDAAVLESLRAFVALDKKK